MQDPTSGASDGGVEADSAPAAGWWRASNDRWYPPELHPGDRPPEGWWQGPDGRWYPTPGPESAPMDPNRRMAAQILLIGGAAGMLLGLFLDWATLGVFSVTGIDTDDGKLHLIVALIAVGLAISAVAGRLNRGLGIAVILLGIIGAAFAAFEMYDLSNLDSGFIEAGIGTGLYVNLIGSIAFTIGGALAAAPRS